MEAQWVTTRDWGRNNHRWLKPGAYIITNKGRPAFSVIIEQLGDQNGQQTEPQSGQEQQSNLDVTQEAGHNGRPASAIINE